MTLEAEDKELSESAVKSSLERLREQYEKSKNPVYAMEAFIMANERGDLNIPIPHWVKRWINSAFIEYWNSSGKEKLETLLGFQYGKGKAPSKDFEKLENFQIILCLKFYLIQIFLGTTFLTYMIQF